MQLRIREWDKEFSSGNLSIRLSMSQEYVNVFVDDTNASIKEVRYAGTGMKEHAGGEQFEKACLNPLKLLMNVETEGTSLNDCICPPPDPCPPSPCPPPPPDDCYQDSYYKEQDNSSSVDAVLTQQRREVRSEHNFKNGYHKEHHDVEEPVTGNVKNAEITILGLKRLGGIKRSLFHSVTYVIKIPQDNFQIGYNRFEIYLKDANGIPNMLLSTGIEKLDFDTAQTSSNNNRETSFSPTADFVTLVNDKLDPKADKSEVDALKAELTQVRNQLNEFIEQSKNPSENLPRNSSKGKA